jgi:hypothetical protein
VLIAVRLIGIPARLKREQQARMEAEAEKDEEYEEDAAKQPSRTRRSRFQIIGIIAILLGIMVLFSSLSLVKWVFWGPVGALAIVALGAFFIYIARRK